MRMKNRMSQMTSLNSNGVASTSSWQALSHARGSACHLWMIWEEYNETHENGILMIWRQLEIYHPWMAWKTFLRYRWFEPNQHRRVEECLVEVVDREVTQ